jgi:Fur family zinc uptake transcriptional regulator
MSQIHGALQALRSKGYKVTEPRKQVLKALTEAERPVSPYDIQKILARHGEHMNHVTIYRILDLFCLLNLAHRVSSLGGFVRCTLGEGAGCHRFVVCRQCGAFHEFADKSLCDEENEIARELGFRTEQHLAESVGLCGNCKKDES